MISIIICSIDILRYKKVKKNIENTIGLSSYEIIKIDNTIKKTSITKAYNSGIDKSKYNILVFIHEDILFHTFNWGNNIIQSFKNERIGLIGVAGTKYKSCYPSAFWHTDEKMLVSNIIQHNKKKKEKLIIKGFKNCNKEDVVVIDGVFMALNKRAGVRFNEDIEGFHTYDLGLSIDVINKNYRIVIVNDVLIEHFSIGVADLNFIKSIIKFHKLYKYKLRKCLKNDSKRLDTIAIKSFLKLCLKNRYIPYRLWLKYLRLNLFSRLNYNLLKLFIYSKLNQ